MKVAFKAFYVGIEFDVKQSAQRGCGLVHFGERCVRILEVMLKWVCPS